MIRGHNLGRTKNLGRLLVSTVFTHSWFSLLNRHHYRHLGQDSFSVSDTSCACGSTTTTNASAIGVTPKYDVRIASTKDEPASQRSYVEAVEEGRRDSMPRSAHT